MQTKKRVSGRNASRGPSSPFTSRSQKKISENAQVSKKKMKELITSSARKQRAAEDVLVDCKVNCLSMNFWEPSSGFHQPRVGFGGTQHWVPANLDPGFGGTQLWVRWNPVLGSTEPRSRFVGTQLWVPSNPALGSLEPRAGFPRWVPSNPRLDGALDQTESSRLDGQTTREVLKSNSEEKILALDASAVNPYCNADSDGVTLSFEVSAKYLAMKNSKLECVDEHSQDPMSTDVRAEDE
ncbi:hypothetical protein SLEP1_g25575 [Rubroshorea leprosula]|uniref:Uncharacterized protein n=1 Tax=Rubroshorea leprosula TaxID=152421 RepID=A0AAV5JTV3_9ROSI|nr:hypothetical protein SLEP1_g25575 [Rubroshorea leprosula]